MPKVELHLHLEGALSPETVFLLSERNGLPLPWKSPEAMSATFQIGDFEGFRQALLAGVRCLRSSSDFAYAVERLGEYLATQNVRYAEVSVTPQFYVTREQSLDAWLDALNRGRSEVQRRWGIQLRWIPDIVRNKAGRAEDIARWASSDRARAAGVVALGLGGPEAGHPAQAFAEVFRIARERGLPANPHAGEGTGPNEVRDTLKHLLPARIGHGVAAAADPGLLRELAQKKLPLEVCITSNLRLGLYPDAASHPLRKLVEAGCRVTLNSDDPVLFGTDLSREYLRAVEECGLTEAQLQACAINALRASYLPAAEKAALRREFEGAPAPSPAVARPREAASEAFRVLRRFDGPSRFCARPVVVAEVAHLRGDDRASADLTQRLASALERAQPPGAAERLASLPPLAACEAQASVGKLVAWTAVALQRWVGLPLQFSASLGASGAGEKLAFEFRLGPVASAAGKLAALLVRAVPARADGAFEGEAKRALDDYGKRFVEAPAGLVPFVRYAEERGIPWSALVESEAFGDFGHGLKRRRIWRHFTGATGYIATTLSTRKDVANTVLRSHGLPVARHALVKTEAAALQAAKWLGAPVVVKPAGTDFGTAVHLDLSSDEEVRAAFATAHKHGPVLVEEQLPGDHYRLMVINGRFTSARRQKAAHVVGDGKRSIARLVDDTNVIRKRNGWKPIPMDEESLRVLAKQGWKPGDVPPEGAEARLRSQGNLSTGGSMDIVTERVHPENAQLAVRAAAIIGIDVAGLDFISPDIARSWVDGAGAICEINVTPGFIFDEQKLILDEWFPRGDEGRIPLVVLLDAAPGGQLGRRLAQALAGSGRTVCHASAAGVYVGERRIAPAGVKGERRARIALGEPVAGAVVLELESADVLENGLPFDRCAVLVGPADLPEWIRATAGTFYPAGGTDPAWEAKVIEVATKDDRKA